MVTYDAELTLNGLLGLADPLLGLSFKRIGDRAAAGLIRALDGYDSAEPYPGIVLSVEHSSCRVADVVRVESGCGDLVEKRLERVVVAGVDNGHVDEQAG